MRAFVCGIAIDYVCSLSVRLLYVHGAALLKLNTSLQLRHCYALKEIKFAETESTFQIN